MPTDVVSADATPCAGSASCRATCPGQRAGPGARAGASEMAVREGDGSKWPTAPSKRSWARTVTLRVEGACAEVQALGIPAHVSVHWSSSHQALIVRCLVLKDGLPSPTERELAAF